MKASYRSSNPNVTVKKDVHPLAAPSLYAQAERATLAAFQAACAANESPRRFMKLMDQAATAVFTAGGVPPELATFYAMSVTADVLERTSKKA